MISEYKINYVWIYTFRRYIGEMWVYGSLGYMGQNGPMAPAISWAMGV